MNEMITERLREGIHTRIRMTTEATGVALTTFTKGSMRASAAFETWEITAKSVAAARERIKPDVILKTVKRIDDQKDERKTNSDSRLMTLSGDGRNSSSPIKREATSQIISQKAMAQAFLALFRVIEVIPWNISAYALRVLGKEDIKIT